MRCKIPLPRQTKTEHRNYGQTPTIGQPFIKTTATKFIYDRQCLSKGKRSAENAEKQLDDDRSFFIPN